MKIMINNLIHLWRWYAGASESKGRSKILQKEVSDQILIKMVFRHVCGGGGGGGGGDQEKIYDENVYAGGYVLRRK